MRRRLEDGRMRSVFGLAAVLAAATPAPSSAASMKSFGGAAKQSQERASVIYPALFESLPSMEGKTVALTGTSRGLGYVTAISLAKKGARLLLLNRASPAAETALEDIANAATGPVPIAVECDLLSFDSVRTAAGSVQAALSKSGGALDVLCCSAGVMMQPDLPSADGYDITASTNVLSHFLLVRELMPALERAATVTGEARVVSMSSGSGFGPPVFDPRFYERNGGALGGREQSYERYHQSKLANMLFTISLHEKLSARGSKVKALACTPGVCATDMFVHVQSLARPGQPADLASVQSVEDGACGQLICICEPTARSGQLFGPQGMGGAPTELLMGPPAVPIDKRSKTELWEACERATGGAFEV
mmetsp:Transcript_34795/g.91436  ORF Transcript_34795/g.91436 Transcript_34795/m.91436 type:complete len:365 (+) Transcript_34795:12-1106(+)|eukprot:CAMPEP_0115845990 /NCGR_PEP_ID=MMETSP0287-20121206/9635_1 /TAXON_ID=412157 /ORGANISM="Chrysochromulina rotalis, Strain UIO044" /LENGTH=364 /DNA_ID=CAMNT_0003299777 /DNA_START=10 /DNA_END=1104 /DNA_ORIENTATION=-